MGRAEVARQTIDVALLPQSAIDRNFVSIDEHGFIELTGRDGQPGPIAIDVNTLEHYRRAVEQYQAPAAPVRERQPRRLAKKQQPEADQLPRSDAETQRHRGLAERLARKMGRMAVRKTAFASAAFLFGASTAYTGANTAVSHIPLLNHLSPSEATYNLSPAHDIKSQAIAIKEVVTGPIKIAEKFIG